MAENEKIVLRKHKMTFMPEIIIDREILDHSYERHCAMNNCNGACCREGVLLDIKDKEKILAHAALIQRYLEPQQEKDPAKWFDENIEYDSDFPSGQCDGTATHGDGCVFLDSNGLCTLQKVAMGEKMEKDALKPFFCFAYPLTIEAGVLTTYDSEFTIRKQCCSTVQKGEQSLLDVCRDELEFMLGGEGLKEFEKIYVDYKKNENQKV
jgi:hypothetical protein